MVDPVTAVLPVDLALSQPVGATSASGQSDFAQWLDQTAGALDSQLEAGEVALRELALGETSNVHHVLMTLEKARLSFSLAVQMRNKLLEGYQEIMRMQI